MRQFYLSKNAYGYYSVNFIDPTTGKKLSAKSTHSRDKCEAYNIASKWLDEGVSAFNANSRAFKYELEGKTMPEVKTKNNSVVIPQSQNLQSFVDSLSQNDVNALIVMLAQKVQGGGIIPTMQIPQTNVQVAQTTASVQMAVQPVIQNVVVQSTTSETVSNENRIPLISYMTEFWDYEKSKHLAEERAYGRDICKRHAKEMKNLVTRYWLPYFGEDRFVDELNRFELEEFFMYLRNERGLAGATVNHAMSCASKMYKYLFKKELITKNPFAGLSRFSAEQIERGIPTETEVAKLMNMTWKNSDSKLAFCIGAFAGLRAGEISGLRVCDLDLDADIIHVRHTWNATDGLKKTKNTDTRDIPIDHDTMLELMALARRNKQFNDLSYVFWSPAYTDRPYNPSWYSEGFYECLAEIGISEDQRQERVIVFHSLRHFCATLLRQRADLATVQSILGHRTEVMTEHYSSHWSESQAATVKNVMSENKKHIMKFLAA